MSSLPWKLACLILCASAVAYAQPVTDPTDVEIEVRDLGNVLPGGHARPEAINDRGDVVGWVIRTDGQWAVWWPQDGNPELFLGTEVQGVAADINNRRQIVGSYSTASGSRGFLWSVDAGIIDLPAGFFPSAINNRGQIAGTCRDSLTASEACVWEDGRLLRLGRLFETLPISSGAYDINERGHVTGESNGYPYLWTPKQGMRQLSDVVPSRGSALNNHDDVVGSLRAFRPIQAFHWERGHISTLDPSSAAMGINERGWVVGTHSTSSGNKAFLWLPDDVVIDLPTLGGSAVEPTAINARGEIVGIAQDLQGFGHAVIWTVRPKSLNGTGR